MLTLPELQVLLPLLDAGIRATGLQLFKDGGGATLQSALGKLQDMATAHGRGPASNDSGSSKEGAA